MSSSVISVGFRPDHLGYPLIFSFAPTEPTFMQHNRTRVTLGHYPYTSGYEWQQVFQASRLRTENDNCDLSGD